MLEYFTNIQKFYFQPIQFTIPILWNRYVVYKPLQTHLFHKLTWTSHTTSDSISEYHGYILHANKPKTMNIPSNVFQCKDETYVDEMSFCDGLQDCTDEIDETQCYCNDISNLFHVTCKYFCDETSQHCSCSIFYFTCSSSFKCIPYLKVCDSYKDCFFGEDEFCKSQLGKKLETANDQLITTFTCSASNTTIPTTLVDDFIPDCPNTFEDEEEYHSLMTNPFHTHKLCKTTNELPCIAGHSHCFQLNKLCIFEFQANTRALKYCRNGAHLYNCTHFQCSEYFKCSLSYCIPFDSVCNGI